MAQKTCFRPRKVLLWIWTMSGVIWGNYALKTAPKGAWIASFKQTRQHLYIAVSPLTGRAERSRIGRCVRSNTTELPATMYSYNCSHDVLPLSFASYILYAAFWDTDNMKRPFIVQCHSRSSAILLSETGKSRLYLGLRRQKQHGSVLK